MPLVLHYEFAADESLVARVGPTLSITRNSVGSYVDDSGVLQVVGSDVARFNHSRLSPYTPLGILVEPSVENLCLQSEDFSTTWSVGAGPTVVNTNAAVAPDGNTTADQLIDDNSSGTGIVEILQSMTVLVSTQYCYSVFLKADQLDIAFLSADGFTTPGNSETWFNLSTGTVGTSDAGFDDAGIEEYDNDWYRCWVVFTTDPADTLGAIKIATSESDGTQASDLDGTSSIFMWGSQFEIGDRPSSYIPTAATPVTRNFDDISSASFTGMNAQAGTFYAHFTPFIAASSGYVGRIDDESNLNRIYHFLNGASANVRAGSITSGGNEIAINDISIPLVDNVPAQLAVGWAADDVAQYLDGAANGTDVSYDAPDEDFTRIYIASSGLGTVLNGHVHAVRYYDERFDDETLEAFSNGEFSSEGGGGGGFGRGIGVRRANEAAFYAYQQRLKREDDEALRLIRQVLKT